MSSITIQPERAYEGKLRPLNIFRDLPLVADLIEVCFSKTMDTEGRRYIQDMRRAGSDNSFMQWANRAVETTALPLTGFVWEEGGKVVGNVSLVPFRHGRQKIYLIANLATHPDFRRRGIAHALTKRAMEHAREKNINQIWLHVRDDNDAAVELYSKLGFLERARRTSWQASTEIKTMPVKPGIRVGGRHPRLWPTQLEWLKRLYPDYLAWHRNWNFNSLRPGFWNWLYLFFIDMNVRQWAATKNEKMEAALAWIPYGHGEALFAAVADESDPEALTAVLLQARRDLFHSHPNLVMEFPAGLFEDAITASGFKILRTLIWMEATA